MKPYLALIRTDIRLAFRQPVVIFFNYLMPLTFFFVFAQAFHAEQGGAIMQVLTMSTVIGILGNGLFGAGMRAVQERENNILRRYKVAPISALPLLVASTVTGLVVYLPYVVLMLFLAKLRYGMTMPPNVASVLTFVTIGVIAVRSIGLIVASVVNSVQESGILVQVVYMTMLFLSGASFPTTMFPNWLLVVTQFIPATHLVTGMQGLLLRQESLGQNWQAVAALTVTAAAGLFLCVKLFRWEKEEKMKPAAKLWVLAVLLPFFVLGTYQARAKDNLRKVKVLDRELSRSRTTLIRNGRIFTGTGNVIENGAVLVKEGRIAEIYSTSIPSPESLHAAVVEAAGKTVLPGLIDTHVHLGAPGGIRDDWKDYDAVKASERALAAYLYCGVTAVRSAGDSLDAMLRTRATVNSGERLGARVFVSGPMFTAAGGHGTEYFRDMPAELRRQAEAEYVRIPRTPEEARQQVEALHSRQVDSIKAIVETGAAGRNFDRMDTAILINIGSATRAAGLPFLVHTGDARDLEDAIRAQASSIEHGSFRQRIPGEDFAAMAQAGVFYDPTLSVGDALVNISAGKTDLLNRSLVQQVVPAKMMASTRRYVAAAGERPPQYPVDMQVARDNLLRAWRAGVRLITGSDAGNPLVFHGPSVQNEIRLWVEGGVPADVALKAATLYAAEALGVSRQLGSIEKGKDASLLIVDGNPLQDIRALEAISSVFLRGERVNRGDLLGQE